MLTSARNAVFGRDHVDFPPFRWEVLDWPDGGEDGDGDAAAQESERASRLEVSEESATKDQEGDACALVDEHGREDGAGAEDAEDDEADGGQNEDGEEDDEDDDAAIETVRELNKLRTHFKWVRDRAKKRRKAHEPLPVDHSGIPKGFLRNIFLVIDQDVIDSIVVNSPMADSAWIWAIDPDYTGDVASMTKNGLRDEYYGYMRVRVQQLVDNFWEARYYREDGLPLRTLWAAARQSHKYAFVSVEPVEARMVHGDMLVGSALRHSSPRDRDRGT
ncbi:hypothetical protein LTR85_009144 [Meristemomyces frigidus]|nr:hypothetical protein LTR85_009144 [Meristemomyces frigidus]